MLRSGNSPLINYLQKSHQVNVQTMGVNPTGMMGGPLQSHHLAMASTSTSRKNINVIQEMTGFSREDLYDVPEEIQLVVLGPSTAVVSHRQNLFLVLTIMTRYKKRLLCR